MSLLRNLVAGPEQRAASVSDVLLALREQRVGTRGYGSPMLISPESSLRHSAVWTSVNLIADMISTLPVDEYRETPAGRPTKEVDPTPLLTDPNRELPPDAVWRQALVSVLLRGNSLGLVVERDDLFYPTKTEIVHPDEVSYKRKGKLGALEVWFNGMKLGPDEYWRLVGYTFPGSPVGLSSISYVAEAIGLGRSAQRFASDFFADGGHPSAILTNDKKVDETGAKRVKAAFLNATQGNREPTVMGDGWKYNAIQINPEESQFLDTIRANRGMIATIFGLRPEDVGESVSGGSVTYANVEQRQIARLVYPIGGWIIRLERALSGLLRPGRIARFNIDATLRVDLMNRYRAHDLSIRGGWKNRNEVRKDEDEDPIPADQGGDEYLWPPYATSVDQTEREDPNA